MDRAINEALPTIIVLEDLPLQNGHNAIVVETEPTAISRGFDVDEVVPSVHVSGMDEDPVEFVVVAF